MVDNRFFIITPVLVLCACAALVKYKDFDTVFSVFFHWKSIFQREILCHLAPSSNKRKKKDLALPLRVWYINIKSPSDYIILLYFTLLQNTWVERNWDYVFWVVCKLACIALWFVVSASALSLSALWFVVSASALSLSALWFVVSASALSLSALWFVVS